MGMIDNQFQIMRNQVVIMKMLEEMAAKGGVVGRSLPSAIIRMNKEKRKTIDKLEKERMAKGLS